MNTTRSIRDSRNWAIAYDGDGVVNAIQVLECNDLVTLDGNTWKLA